MIPVSDNGLPLDKKIQSRYQPQPHLSRVLKRQIPARSFDPERIETSRPNRDGFPLHDFHVEANVRSLSILGFVVSSGPFLAKLKLGGCELDWGIDLDRPALDGIPHQVCDDAAIVIFDPILVVIPPRYATCEGSLSHAGEDVRYPKRGPVSNRVDAAERIY